MNQPANKKTLVTKSAGFPPGILLLALIGVVCFLFTRVDFLGTGPGMDQPAPEIRGTTQDGSTVRLSDFRKKVVFLDFWGDW